MVTWYYRLHSKKGKSSSLENQRGIAKSCAFAKLTNKLLFARIRDIIEPQLLGVQSGFRAGRSTVEQTMALRYILEMCRVSNVCPHHFCRN